MLARSTGELHRASTPLELFFDLIFVVAISLNAAGLHHGIAEGHSSGALLSYGMQFMVIWWAWMRFTWFASAFDTDDVPYRLMVFVQMAGSLVIAAGIPAAFEHFDFRTITVGYTIMRVGLVSLWLRAGKSNPPLKPTTQHYAVGLMALQLLWIGLLFVPKTWVLPGFAILIVLEMLLPIWSERSGKTSWHPEHITERYSLFTIIVMGESVLATVLAIKNSLTPGGISADAMLVIFCALLILLSTWWLYFDKPHVDMEQQGRLQVFVWSYGHYFIFASVAAMGVGLALSVESVNGSLHIGPQPVQWAIAIPVAVYLLSLWLVHFGQIRHSAVAKFLFPLVAALVLASATLAQVSHTMMAIAALTCCLLATLLCHHYDATPVAAH